MMPLADQMLRGIDRVAWDAMARANDPWPEALRKLVDDPARECAKSAMRLIEVGAVAGTGGRFLDISTAGGFTPYGARLLGYEEYCTDTMNPPYDMLAEFRQMLGVTRFEEMTCWRRKTGDLHCDCAKLPFPGVKFDLMTAVAFPPMNYWREEEWIEFIEDVSERLNPGGWCWAKINRDPTDGDLGLAALSLVAGFDAKEHVNGKNWIKISKGEVWPV